MSVLLYVGIRNTLCMYHLLCYVQLHALCSVTCYFTYVALCYVAYILFYICNFMLHL